MLPFNMEKQMMAWEVTTMNAYKELTAWITDHKPQFDKEKYTLDDIVNLAIACGFDRSSVAQWRVQQMFKKVA